MPKPSPSSEVELEPVALPPEAGKRLAALLGHKRLPEECGAELGACLAAHLAAARVQRERKNNAAPGDTEAAIADACRTLEELVGLDSGIDAESLRILRPHARSFIAAARDRITELLGMPRAQAHQELLRRTCPRLRLIFERYAASGANRRAGLRLFAFEALRAAAIDTGSIDKSRLGRLDEYLDASLRR